MENFERLLCKVSPLLLSVKERGFETPSEIQEKSIPDILLGKDVIAGASTGSGKTLAFAAGLINNTKKDFGIQGLVLTPTRELAEQITNELLDFSKHQKLKITPVYGGVSINNQINCLRKTDIVVGTPGRILDHLQRKSIDLSGINTLVLDEADRMLDMGFMEQVEKIIEKCQKNRQTLLFSATISQDVAHLAQKYTKEAVEISAEPLVDPKKLYQMYYDVQDSLKYSLLKHLLENENAKLVMIFCNTRRNVDFIAKNLTSMGVECMPIHGGYSQSKRNDIIKKFHSKKIHVLIATDVAARGLDIEGVSHVYNYDIPKTRDEYIHRIGRTARAGNEGKVMNLVASRDYDNFNNIINGDFEITLEKTPLVKKEEITWMDRRNQRPRRFSGRGVERDNRSNRGFRGGREGNREDGREKGLRREDSRFGERRNTRPRRPFSGSRPRNSSSGRRGSAPRRSFGDRRNNRGRSQSSRRTFRR